MSALNIEIHVSQTHFRIDHESQNIWYVAFERRGLAIEHAFIRNFTALEDA